MQCKKCGFIMPDSERFCNNCGEPLIDMNSQNFNQPGYMQNMGNNFNNGMPYPNNGMNGQQYMNGNFNPNMPYNYQQNMQSNPNNNVPKKKKSKVPIIIGVVAAIVLIIVILVVLFIILPGGKAEKLVCESPEGNITITFNKNGLTGYTSSGIRYELEQQNEIAKQIGINEYLKEFNEWFTSNTTGKCTVRGKELEKSESSNNTSPKMDTKIVGDDTRGYIAIPSIWGNFEDVDGSTSLQYSYSNLFIVSLDVLDGNYSAKEYAANYMTNKQSSSDVSGVTGATVKIGRNKEYTAYQVYMYYPSEKVYLITYWFEAEDGKVHYIALEGPEEVDGKKLTDYLLIAESFSLKKPKEK